MSIFKSVLKSIFTIMLRYDVKCKDVFEEVTDRDDEDEVAIAFVAKESDTAEHEDDEEVSVVKFISIKVLSTFLFEYKVFSFLL